MPLYRRGLYIKMRKLPKIITKEEFEKIFKAADNVKRIPKKRIKKMKVAMLLGFEAGMRISEIVGFKDRVPRLTQQKVDMQGNKIFITEGKGKKDRIVPLPKRFNKTAYNLLPIDVERRTLQRFVTNLGKKVLGKDISFHTLRHGFATRLIDSGVPLHEVQGLMGHSRLDTTGIYLHANPTKAIEAARDAF